MTRKIISVLFGLISYVIVGLLFGIIAYVYYAYTYINQTPMGFYEFMLLMLYSYFALIVANVVSDFIENKILEEKQNGNSTK